MATTSIWSIKNNLKQSINYIINPKKTINKEETKEKRVGNQEIAGKTDRNRCEIREAGTEIFGAGYGKEERIDAMKLSKYEKETIILTNEEDQYYSVYTFNQGLQKRLKNFAERYPECCYLSNSTKEGSERNLDVQPD